MRLGIDLDGVVADFNAGWIRHYNVDFGTEIPSDAVQVWSVFHQLTHFVDRGAFWQWAKNLQDGSLFRHLETYHGAVEALTKLDGLGHGVVIITAKPDWAVHDTFAWIAEHRIPTREVHITHRKWQVECDVYLEDAQHQLVRIREGRPKAVVCRFVRPWNNAIEGVDDIENWEQFIDLVSSIS